MRPFFYSAPLLQIQNRPLKSAALLKRNMIAWRRGSVTEIPEIPSARLDEPHDFLAVSPQMGAIYRYWSGSGIGPRIRDAGRAGSRLYKRDARHSGPSVIGVACSGDGR
jgi:hypothetical protein